jgi:hypothetical protein
LKSVTLASYTRIHYRYPHEDLRRCFIVFYISPFKPEFWARNRGDLHETITPD